MPDVGSQLGSSAERCPAGRSREEASLWSLGEGRCREECFRPEPRGSQQGLSRQMLDDDDKNKITTPRVAWIPVLCQTLCIHNLV